MAIFRDKNQLEGMIVDIPNLVIVLTPTYRRDTVNIRAKVIQFLQKHSNENDTFLNFASYKLNKMPTLRPHNFKSKHENPLKTALLIDTNSESGTNFFGT